MPDDDRKLLLEDAARAAGRTKQQRGEFAVYKSCGLDIVYGKVVQVDRAVRVRVMARAEGYAMVRLPRAMPFVVSESELSPEPAAAAVGRG